MIAALWIAMFDRPSVQLQLTDPKPVINRWDVYEKSVKMEIVNRSSAPIQFWSTVFEKNHKVRLTTLQGVAVPMTTAGINASRQFGSYRRDHTIPYVIQPGGSYKYESGGIADWFDVSPGRYLLFVTYEDRSFKDQLVLRMTPTVITVKH